jgi:antitoxin FitA
VADIVLRNLDEDLKERLRVRAARNSRSMNAELGEIVRLALTPPKRASTDRASLKKLASDIRALSDVRRQTPSEDLLREGRGER